MSSADEAALRALVERFNEGWNKKDLEEIVSVFDVNIDQVNALGRRTKGREQVEEEVRRALPAFRESVHVAEGVDIDFLRPDLAVVHLEWSAGPVHAPDGTLRERISGVFTWLTEKRDDSWTVRVLQNTFK